MKTSRKLRAWKARQKRGAIMKPSTFAAIAQRAGGGEKGKRIAGAAYWKAARAKFKRRRKKK